jgi:four helix bundle protein
LTRCLPPEEQFVAITQLRRASWSVANNIAEGNARRGRGELRQFFNVAIGSLAEIDGMVDVLPDLYRLDPQLLATIEALRQEITRGLFGILRRNGR